VNEDTGDVVFPTDHPMPPEYTVRSVLAEPDTDTLEVATAVRVPLDENLQTSPVAHDLGTRAREIVGSVPQGDYQRLYTLEEHLRKLELDEGSDAPGGHGLRQISQLLEDGVGTAEQYASAFAVLARMLGYQSRVVVGFRPREVDDQPGVYEVSGQDVHAWAEVRFEYLGWVRFDPTPVGGSNQEGGSEPAESSDRPSPDDPTEPDEPESSAPPYAAGGPAAGSGLDPRRLAWYGGSALAVLLGVLVLSLAAVPLAKTTRRHRRRSARNPRLRVLGAWRDTLDRLREAGLTTAPADTSGEVAAAARQRFGAGVTRPLRRLSRLHDAAAFAPGQAVAAAAEAAWTEADEVRRAVSGTLHPLRRVRAAISPGPLLLRRRKAGRPARRGAARLAVRPG
jgi:hypothetical protein